MSAEEALLEELVFQVLERHESGDASALDELCAAHPTRASALRARVESLARSGLVGGRDDLPVELGEFRVLRRLGQGGMGVVLLAEQSRLGRQVALKMVRPEQLYFRGARERFQREVEAIARLSHPGIVPIFTVGEAGGAPYYAMELVVGASLHEVLQRLRAQPPGTLRGVDLAETVVALARERGFAVAGVNGADPLFGGSWNDACAWLAREVAQALEHAHQRGVLHRDVKPSNILITPDGRVLLTDFGLAATSGDERITRQGAQLGSLAYMAPEQASGALEAVGPRADVFGLGVTLYEALALELPWPAGGAAPGPERRAVALRARRADVPADFELVCATAMESDVSRRYPSAAHLARDLSNLLQRRPIEARPLGAGLALRRWAQRHPAGATATALLLAVAIVGPLLYGVQEARARRELAVERDLAQANLSAALDAIEVTLEKVGHRDLREVPRVDAIKRQLLEQASTLYARLAQSAPDDPRVELRAAAVLGRLGRLRRDTGDLEGAKRDWNEAERRMRAHLERFGENSRTLYELGSLLTYSTVMLNPVSSPEAVDALQRAVALLRRACELDPSALRPKHELARGLLGLAHLEDALRREDDAVARWTEVEALAEPLSRAELDPVDGLELLLTASGRLATILQRRGDSEGARAQMDRIVELSDGIEQPSSFLRHLRAMTFETLARIGPAAAAEDRGAEWAARANAELALLTRDFPRNDSFQSGLALNWQGLAERARRAGDDARARELFSESERAYQRLAALAPTDPNAFHHLGQIALARAELEREAGKLDDARDLALEARAKQHEAHRLAGRVVRPEQLLGVARFLAEIGVLLGDPGLLADAAAEIFVCDRDPISAASDAARVLVHAHDAALSAGDEASAQHHLDAARSALESALAADPVRRASIAEAIEALGLAERPGFAELLARAREP